MRITMAKDAFNRKTSVSTSNLNIELGKKMVRCYVWSISLLDSENWTQKTGAIVFGELRNVVMEGNGEDKMMRECNK
jgi:hypothetical protein